MKRAFCLAALGLCVMACEGSEIAIFSVEQAGASGNLAATGNAAGESSSGVGGSNDTGLGNLAGNAGTLQPACQSTADCESNSFCSKPSCADARGVCLPRPFPDDALSAHVCGCDHITYWNDSLRQWYGVSASTTGVCNQSQRSCDHDSDCGSPDASCAHLLPPDEACGSPVGLGQCWIIPRDCSATDNLHFEICPLADSDATPVCASMCQAIQSGHSFMQLPRSQSCPPP